MKFQISNFKFLISNKRGITLAEVVIALGITTIVGTLLVVIIVNTTGLFYKESSKVEQGLGINDALLKIKESIKEASSIAANYPSGSPVYTTGDSQIVLKVPSIDNSSNIISQTFDYFIFYKDAGKLRFKIFPDALSSRKSQDQIFSTNVDSLKFQYFNSANPPLEVSPTTAAKVKITLSLRQKSGVTFEKNTATSEASLRND